MGTAAVSGVVDVIAVGLSWLAITVAMLLLYVLVIGPGLENVRDAAFRALRSSATYEEMHESDTALGITGMALVVGVGPLIVMTYLGLIEWSL